MGPCGASLGGSRPPLSSPGWRQAVGRKALRPRDTTHRHPGHPLRLQPRMGHGPSLWGRQRARGTHAPHRLEGATDLPPSLPPPQHRHQQHRSSPAEPRPRGDHPASPPAWATTRPRRSARGEWASGGGSPAPHAPGEGKLGHRKPRSAQQGLVVGGPWGDSPWRGLVGAPGEGPREGSRGGVPRE